MVDDRSLFLKVKGEENILRIFGWSEQKLLDKAESFMIFLVYYIINTASKAIRTILPLQIKK